MGSPLFPFSVGSLPLFIQPRIVSLTRTACGPWADDSRTRADRVNLQHREIGGWLGETHSWGLTINEYNQLGGYDLDRHTDKGGHKRTFLCSAHAFFANS